MKNEMNEMNEETDTPRSDRAALVATHHERGLIDVVDLEFAEALELELNESKANQKALKQFENYCRIAIRDALNAANAPTHYPDIGAPARKPMRPVERIAAIAKQRDALAEALRTILKDSED